MNAQMKAIYGVVTRNGKSWWTPIGVAFQNRGDGSWNLKFDYLPSNLAETTIQLREIKTSTPEASIETDDLRAA